jgi:hypothetical protein
VTDSQLLVVVLIVDSLNKPKLCRCASGESLAGRVNIIREDVPSITESVPHILLRTLSAEHSM